MSDAMADGDAYTRVFAYPRVCKVLVEMADRFSLVFEADPKTVRLFTNSLGTRTATQEGPVRLRRHATVMAEVRICVSTRVSRRSEVRGMSAMSQYCNGTF
jgi:hypothetical protein